MNEIEVYADVWCPFTHVGLRRFVDHRAEHDAPLVLRVRAWPLELVNGRPLDADFVGEEIEEIRGLVAPDLFSGFDIGHFPTTTLPALDLTGRAYEISAEVGEAVALDLRDRLFEQGQDIGDLDLLRTVADGHAIDASGLTADGPSDRVRAEWEQGQARGVVGSPHFFTPGGDFFCPALDVRRVDGHLRITADPDGFDAFLRACT